MYPGPVSRKGVGGGGVGGWKGRCRGCTATGIAIGV